MGLVLVKIINYHFCDTLVSPPKVMLMLGLVSSKSGRLGFSRSRLTSLSQSIAAVYLVWRSSGMLLLAA